MLKPLKGCRSGNKGKRCSEQQRMEVTSQASPDHKTDRNFLMMLGVGSKLQERVSYRADRKSETCFLTL